MDSFSDIATRGNFDAASKTKMLLGNAAWACWSNQSTFRGTRRFFNTLIGKSSVVKTIDGFSASYTWKDIMIIFTSVFLQHALPTEYKSFSGWQMLTGVSLKHARRAGARKYALHHATHIKNNSIVYYSVPSGDNGVIFAVIDSFFISRPIELSAFGSGCESRQKKRPWQNISAVQKWTYFSPKTFPKISVQKNICFRHPIHFV